jgi:hypothetical protein
LLAEDLDVEPEDLIHLERYTSYVKLLSGEVRHPTFSLRWWLPPQGSRERATLIREQTQQRETRPAHLIDARLAEAVIRVQAASPVHPDETVQHASQQQQRTATPVGKDAGQESQQVFTSKYRGRRSQQKRAGQAAPKPMNWQETVGAQRGDGQQHMSGREETRPQAVEEEREEDTVRLGEEEEALLRQEERDHDEPEQET